MEITKKRDGGTLKIALEGRLDTSIAPEFEEFLKQEINGVTDIEFDFKKLEYISSAGLRVLLSTQKIMNTQGTMKVKNVCPEIMEVFDITGFSEILTIE